ncbi:hypothetical protein [Hydrogenophaga sp.]|uniref:hypothetical protein n=1 Tax=Hydrogenophaga sp. TaxID=1904254 RepID=UPI00262B78FA|nr:hypothetical protein [Hydrogenophaga sp.]MCW5652632.1 hypothetical protein [Hydrogenophaga sp.]
MVKSLGAALAGLLAAGCASTSSLVPAPFATASDPEWIQSFDAGLREKQTQTVNSFGGRVESKLALWEQLDCSRRVYVSQARAAQIKATETGAAVNDAMRQVTAEPMWILARNSCR